MYTERQCEGLERLIVKIPRLGSGPQLDCWHDMRVEEMFPLLALAKKLALSDLRIPFAMIVAERTRL